MKKALVRYTEEELSKLPSETDWNRLTSMREDEIICDEDSPDIALAIKTGTMRKAGRPRRTDKKVLVSIRIEPDTLTLLRSLGPGWQTKLSRKIALWAKDKNIRK